VRAPRILAALALTAGLGLGVGEVVSSAPTSAQVRHAGSWQAGYQAGTAAFLNATPVNLPTTPGYVCPTDEGQYALGVCDGFENVANGGDARP